MFIEFFKKEKILAFEPQPLHKKKNRLYNIVNSFEHFKPQKVFSARIKN